MKRLISILVVLAMVGTLSGCFGKKPSNENSSIPSSDITPSSEIVSSDESSEPEISEGVADIEAQMQCLMDHAEEWMMQDYAYLQVYDMDENGLLEVVQVLHTFDEQNNPIYYNWIHEVDADANGVHQVTFKPTEEGYVEPDLATPWRGYRNPQTGVITWVFENWHKSDNGSYCFLCCIEKQDDYVDYYCIAQIEEIDGAYYYYDANLEQISEEEYYELEPGYFANYEPLRFNTGWVYEADCDTVEEMLAASFSLTSGPHHEGVWGDGPGQYDLPTEEDVIIDLARVYAGWLAYLDGDASYLEQEFYWPVLVNAMSLAEYRIGSNFYEENRFALSEEGLTQYAYTVFPYTEMPAYDESWIQNENGYLHIYADYTYSTDNTEILDITTDEYGNVTVIVSTLDETNTCVTVYLTPNYTPNAFFNYYIDYAEVAVG